MKESKKMEKRFDELRNRFHIKVNSNVKDFIVIHSKVIGDPEICPCGTNGVTLGYYHEDNSLEIDIMRKDGETVIDFDSFINGNEVAKNDVNSSEFVNEIKKFRKG